GGVAHKTVIHHAYIQAHDVPELEPPRSRQPVNDLFVHRNANLARKLPVTQKRAASTVMFHSHGRVSIDFAGRHPGLNEGRNLIQDRGGDVARGPHRFQITFALENDHSASSRLSTKWLN